MGWLVIHLPRDRSVPGALRAFTDEGRVALGPVPCLGKADTRGAAAHGNPTRDPVQPFGDLPTGSYLVTGLSPVDLSSPEEVNTYGPHGKLVLEPLAGAALEAKANGRYGLLIHGGLPGPGQKLRPTFGCARLFDPDMEHLVALHRGQALTRCIVQEDGDGGADDARV